MNLQNKFPVQGVVSCFFIPATDSIATSEKERFWKRLLSSYFRMCASLGFGHETTSLLLLNCEQP